MIFVKNWWLTFFKKFNINEKKTNDTGVRSHCFVLPSHVVFLFFMEHEMPTYCPHVIGLGMSGKNTSKAMWLSLLDVCSTIAFSMVATSRLHMYGKDYHIRSSSFAVVKSIKKAPKKITRCIMWRILWHFILHLLDLIAVLAPVLWQKSATEVSNHSSVHCHLWLLFYIAQRLASNLLRWHAWHSDTRAS